MSLFFLDELTPFAARVLGEDWAYFSQPRFVYEDGPAPRFFGGCQLRAVPGVTFPRALACLARCTDVVAVHNGTGDAARRLLCGAVAGVDLRGRHLCTLHASHLWQCFTCEAFLPHGDGGYCSRACKEEDTAWTDSLT